MPDRRFVLTLLATLALVLVLPSLADAQCAMCNETARTGTADHPENAKALNNGILFLMALPYILLSTLLFIWWRWRKKSQKTDPS